MRRTLPLALLALLITATPAGAAPRVGSVDGIAFENNGNSRFVVFDVSTSGASTVRVSWGKRGAARQPVQNGRAGLGFGRRGANSYRVSVRACRRSRCSRARRFSGRFRIVRAKTDPPRNSPNVPAPQQQGVGSVVGIVNGVLDTVALEELLAPITGRP